MAFSNILKTIRLPKEEDEEFTFAEIEEGVYFRGHNLWLLVISMGIACIGLNINSAAAVIGAMLISPLMGPIVGLSFGLSIGNKKLVNLSLYNWAIMIGTSLLASTVYFLISPFHSETSQLSSFKEATIFDCLLALFGGFAWFLGIIRKEAIKVIAGVAVSTACIPPLCTAGYGLATWNWEYFFGGMYFYLINCFFIGVGTWILSVILGYQKFYLERGLRHNKKIILVISMLSILILIPSILLTVRKWNAEKFKNESSLYIEEVQKKFPKLTIVSHKETIENGKKMIDITVLNTKNFVTERNLEKANLLNNDIHLRWHYAPDKTDASEIVKLQLQINELKKQMEAQKTRN
ncbi:DUF389 domain-containing protein [Kaistella montana]|uniref:DUF389 domain-containing protein n=1 Tax=Kaistella montana TaxID=1849733 RepID=A0ABW5K9W1_9FLAO|nr:DUF389 domain-containing protein [Kaistella montana]MCQ4035800.1 DUF389 domain-containing protein [Kaistella montana]